MNRLTARQACRLAAAAVLWTAAGGTPASPQVVTEDPGLIAQVAKTVTGLTAELKQATAIAGTVSSVLNVQHNISAALGAIGPGLTDIGGESVGQLIASAQLGFQSVKDAKTAYETISGEIHQLSTDPLGSMSLLTMFQAITSDASSQITSTNQSITAQIAAMNQVMSGQMSVGDAANAIATNMYVSSQSPSAGDIENVNATRRAVVQNAAITAMTAAASAAQSISDNGQTALASLSSGVTNASDERGDVKANSTIILKITEQVAGQNSLLARLIYLESANAMANQSVYGPSATGVMAPPGQPQPVMPCSNC